MGPGSNATITEEMYRASLLSAVEDKMRRRLHEVFDQAQAELNVLTKTQEDLQKGRQKLDDMLQRLEREQNDVEENMRQLQQKDEEIREVLTKMESSEEVSIDDAIQPSAPLYKQLLNAFAEEQATEDAIYYMGEALRKGVIELDVFLKQVRELSRRQFMCRMLIRKCRQTAGLPDISG
jgi:ESCRT-I complex subunit TSG101